MEVQLNPIEMEVKKIEWKDHKPTHAKGPTSSEGWLNEEVIANIRVAGFDEDGVPVAYEGSFLMSAKLIELEFSAYGPLDKVKAQIQSRLARWWDDQVKRYTI